MTKDEIRDNPHQHGREAFHNGTNITANPFRNTEGDADAYTEWEAGWKSAKEETEA